jgi:hypothetical protein
LYIFGGLECVGQSFAYVAHFEFLRDVLIRTQRDTVASRRATFGVEKEDELLKIICQKSLAPNAKLPGIQAKEVAGCHPGGYKEMSSIFADQ